jgi:hypothetical protein
MSEREYRICYVDGLLGEVSLLDTLVAPDDQTAYQEAKARRSSSSRRWFLFDDHGRIVVEGDDLVTRFPMADLVYRRPLPGTRQNCFSIQARTPAGLRWTALAKDPDDFGDVSRAVIHQDIMPRLFQELAEKGIVAVEDKQL